MLTRMILTGVVSGFLAACGGSSNGFGGGDGSLSLGVTDAPVDDADAVVVSFSGIQLLNNQGGVAKDLTFDEPQQVDLLSQQGDQQFFLIRDEPVPAGIYREVRLQVEGMTNSSCNQALSNPDYPSYITVSGVDYPLIVPSGGSSGFKVKGPITIAAGGSAAYTVDFDLRKSISERGATGCYNLRPVLRVVDNAQTGTLSGSVDPVLLADASCTSNPASGAGAAVYVFDGAGTIPDDFDGNDPEPLTTALLSPVVDDAENVISFDYEVGFLLAGNYTVALSCQAGDDAPAPSDDAIGFIGAGDVLIEPDANTPFDFSAVAPVEEQV